MLKHIVLFKLKPETAPEDALKMKELLEQLPAKIAVIQKLEVVLDNISEDNFDLALLTEFNNKEDLDSYAIHPEHLKVVDFIKPRVSARACVDSI